MQYEFRGPVRLAMLAVPILALAAFLYSADFSFYILPLRLVESLYLYSGIFLLILAAGLYALKEMEKGHNDGISGIRRFIARGLGVLWIVDGVLQLQPQMAFGFGQFVLHSSESSLPSPLAPAMQHLVYLWSGHEVLLNAASGAFQIFIGMALLTLASRRSVKLVAAVSLFWSMGLWIAGEGMGGILSGGSSFITGFPGSALLYAVGSAILIASMPEVAARRTAIAAMSIIFALSAIIQALPSSGFWTSGALGLIPSGLSVNPQPGFMVPFMAFFQHVLSIQWVPWNLIFIALLSAVSALWVFKPGIAVPATLILAAFTWVVGQDFGVFGFYSTDLNTAPVVALFCISLSLSRERSIAGKETASLHHEPAGTGQTGNS